MLSSKSVISRIRHRIRILNFNETISEGNVFVAYGQRISDLLNDDRMFLPLETDDGDVKVVSKRAIAEIEIIDSAIDDRTPDESVTTLVMGSAHDVLGAPPDADDSTIRAIYLDRLNSIDEDRIREITDNKDLLRAAAALRQRYDFAYDSITNSRRIEAIGEAIKAAKPKRRRFGED
ncbi:MAG: hypothetical protein AAGB02_07025 [Pseudomonadota bacterium]